MDRLPAGGFHDAAQGAMDKPERPLLGALPLFLRRHPAAQQGFRQGADERRGVLVGILRLDAEQRRDSKYGGRSDQINGGRDPGGGSISATSPRVANPR